MPGRGFFLVSLLALLAATTGLALHPGGRAVLPDPESLHGSQPYATILCRFAGPSNTDIRDWPVSYYDRLMLGERDSLDDYWRRVSNGAIDLAGSKAFGWFQMSKPFAAYLPANLARADLDALARDCTAAADAGDKGLHFPEYTGINMVFSECVDRPRGGAMTLRLDGRARMYRLTWLCPGYPSSHQIVAHEMGHSFGLTHSEDIQGSEYGNNWDLMSNVAYCAPTTDIGNLAQQPIAYGKDLLGWIAPADKYTAGPSGVVTIRLDDLDHSRASPGGYLMAVLPLPGGRFYTVEARGRTGYDVALPTDGVLIHEIDPRRDNRARLIHGEREMGAGALLSATGGWPAGSVFIDREHDVAVAVDKQEERGFIVTLYTGALPWPLPAQEVEQHAAQAAGTIPMRWQATPGARQYQVQVTRVLDSEASGEWGATFVADAPKLDAPLGAGRYRWQVRAMPDGGWSPPQLIQVAEGPSWQPVEQVAHLAGTLRVPPKVSARASGRVEIAWAYADQQRAVAVTRAAWQGTAWAVEDFLNVPPVSRRGMALSFTPAGELRVTLPGALNGTVGMSSPAVAVDAGGRAHTIWAGTGRGVRGIFSAIIDAHEPSAGPSDALAAMPTPAVRPVPVSSDAPGAPKYSPAVALDGDDKAQALWVDTRDGYSAVYGAEQHADGLWGPSQRLSGMDRAAFGRPALSVSSDGHAYAAWLGGLNCGGPVSLVEVTFAERPTGGGAWQTPVSLIVITDRSQMIDPVVAANDAGEVHVAWGEIKGGAYRLYSAFRGRSGQWESPRLAAEGRTDAMSMALSLAVNDGGNAYLTWAETAAAQTSVQFAATRR